MTSLKPDNAETTAVSSRRDDRRSGLLDKPCRDSISNSMAPIALSSSIVLRLVARRKAGTHRFSSFRINVAIPPVCNPSMIAKRSRWKYRPRVSSASSPSSILSGETRMLMPRAEKAMTALLWASSWRTALANLRRVLVSTNDVLSTDHCVWTILLSLGMMGCWKPRGFGVRNS